MNKRVQELAEQATRSAMWPGDPNAGELNVEKFAELVRADEREECAKVAENGLLGHTIAKAIRARGNT